MLEFVRIIERQLNNYFCRKIACSNYYGVRFNGRNTVCLLWSNGHSSQQLLSSCYIYCVCSFCEFCCLVNSFIVTGDVLGHVKFFDQELKLLNWYFNILITVVSTHEIAFGRNAPSLDLTTKRFCALLSEKKHHFCVFYNR